MRQRDNDTKSKHKQICVMPGVISIIDKQYKKDLEWLPL